MRQSLEATAPSSPNPAPHRGPPPPPADDWALFLDVDGCLLPFAERPDAVSVPATLLARLVALRASLGGALALVSGRSLTTLDRLFAPERFTAAGLHGVERRRADGIGHGAPSPAALAAIRDEAVVVARRYPGAVVEDKGAALGLHWRGAPQAEVALRTFAQAMLPRLPGYQLQPGDHVVELRPEHADKGSAILAFLEEAPFAGRRPVFAGDDLTDETGFAAVNARGGISVLVGDRAASAAQFALADPAQVHRWLGVPASLPAPPLEISR
ncbi:trehalose-phosphatase [Luteimonas sp. RC10]|uniref:trehalose-phosphatase n=1 Tax=Luteimonas sp. RC10 TaxID=2587035 RepID=UPI0016072FFE|nr:trehalose-phosphatase [Luteimonas sp. RC10]MBB3344163.1 trehalose 6-phosphate phosphatase [Luteimonas sp. RC10]